MKEKSPEQQTKAAEFSEGQIFFVTGR